MNLRGTDHVQEQISKHIFTPNGRNCIIILQIFLATQAVLKIEEYHSEIPQFYLDNSVT